MRIFLDDGRLGKPKLRDKEHKSRVRIDGESEARQPAHEE